MLIHGLRFEVLSRSAVDVCGPESETYRIILTLCCYVGLLIKSESFFARLGFAGITLNEQLFKLESPLGSFFFWAPYYLGT